MSLFVVIGRDAPNTLSQRMEVRAQHLARLEVLKAQGKLIIAGPMPYNPQQLSDGVHGSLMIVDFDDRAALDAWLSTEPYTLAGVFSEVEVYPFLGVIR